MVLKRGMETRRHGAQRRRRHLDQATAAIQAAGLVGTISNTTSCDVTAGEIACTTPKGGNLVLTGTTVNLKKSTGLPRNGCA
jgi:beta-lactam-binding protein with PASTA domain